MGQRETGGDKSEERSQDVIRIDSSMKKKAYYVCKERIAVWCGWWEGKE